MADRFFSTRHPSRKASHLKRHYFTGVIPRAQEMSRLGKDGFGGPLLMVLGGLKRSTSAMSCATSRSGTILNGN